MICCDEKTGMQILERKYPTQPAQPGNPEKREFEYIRHGTRTLMTSFVVPTGEVVWDLGRRGPVWTSPGTSARWPAIFATLLVSTG